MELFYFYQFYPRNHGLPGYKQLLEEEQLKIFAACQGREFSEFQSTCKNAKFVKCVIYALRTTQICPFSESKFSLYEA